MQEFVIRLRSVADVEGFVSLSTRKHYHIYVSDGDHTINGKSFMEMFCLVLTRPLTVTADCSDDELGLLRCEASRFLAAE